MDGGETPVTVDYKIRCAGCPAWFHWPAGADKGRPAAKALGWQLWTVTDDIWCPKCWPSRRPPTRPVPTGDARRWNE